MDIQNIDIYLSFICIQISLNNVDIHIWISIKQNA